MHRFCTSTRREGHLILTVAEQKLLKHLRQDPMAPEITDEASFLASLPHYLIAARHTDRDGYHRSVIEYLFGRTAAEAAFERRGASWCHG